MTAGTGPVPRPGIEDIEAYVPGRSRAGGANRVIKLSSNETPLGPSPKAVKAYRAAGQALERYPDGAAHDLRAAIAKAYGLDAERIVCGHGSDELLDLVARCYLGPGDEAIYTQHGFLVYPNIIRAAGARPVVAPERDLHTDVDAILACVTPRTKAVFIANPNNPTGTYIPIDEVRRLRAGLPRHVLLVLDAAYAEYVRRNDYEAGLELVATTSNTVMTRTFSKIYGLAGLRLGWMYAPEAVAGTVNRVRGPFNVSVPAIAAGVAAIGDAKHMQAAADHNAVWLAWLAEELSGLGLDVTESVANFLLVHFPHGEGRTAADADQYLAERGILLRAMGAYGFPNALRMTVGTEEENRIAVEAIGDFIKHGGVAS